MKHEQPTGALTAAELRRRADLSLQAFENARTTTMEMDLEPDMPEGVTIVRGAQTCQVKGASDLLGTIWLPAAPGALAKVREVIDRLLWEASERQQADGRRQTAGIAERILEVASHSATVLFLAFLLFSTIYLLATPVEADAQSMRDAIEILGRVNRAAKTRTADGLSKPCRVGTRIYVDGVWYDCRADGGKVQGGKREVADASPSALGPLQIRTAKDRMYRTRLAEAAAQPANFARHYVLSYWGCGMDCLMGAAIDKRTGLVVWLPFHLTSWAQGTPPAASEWEWQVVRPLMFSKRKAAGHHPAE